MPVTSKALSAPLTFKEMDNSSPSEVQELIQGRKILACQIISCAYEDLRQWASPHTTYRVWMREEISKTRYLDSVLFELHFFFFGYKDEPSALQTLIQEFELDGRLGAVKETALPLLKEATKQFNAARVEQGLTPWQHESYEETP